MNDDKYEVLGGGVHQLKKRCNPLPLDLQLFALAYNKVDNPYEHILLKKTYTKADIKVVYNLRNYYQKITNYETITSLPEENANYIKEALPNVTNCYKMLYGCMALTSIDTTGWDTSKITDMSYMFRACNKLTALDVSKWDTSKVTSMYNMFMDCNSLTSLDVSKWDTNNVNDMNRMFFGCSSLTKLDISNWDTSKITDMSYMFQHCSNLTTITGVINMKSCTSYDGMFYGCDNLTGVKIKNPPSGFDGAGLTSSQYEIVS